MTMLCLICAEKRKESKGFPEIPTSGTNASVSVPGVIQRAEPQFECPSSNDSSVPEVRMHVEDDFLWEDSLRRAVALIRCNANTF